MNELLRKLVAAPSLSRQESRIADLVTDELESRGFAVRRSGANVWCEFGDAPRPRLLFNSHLDTVPPGAGWTADPWMPRNGDGRIVGLGANDAKGCVTAFITAATALHQSTAANKRLGGTIVLALTAEEEISGAGLSTILEQLRPLDAALIGEPTGLIPMIAQRGLLILRCTARGRTAHPANTPPELADNAIAAAAGDICDLSKFDWGRPHPLLGRTHANVTMITGGVSRNVIPDACEFFVDVRTTPLESHEALTERLRRALKSEVNIHSERLVPVETCVETPLVHAIRAVLPDCKPSGSPAMSDMVFLSGVPCVKIGPGDSARSHTPDEYIESHELEAGANAYENIAREYFQQAD